MFNIGDKVYFATFGMTQEYVQCPDCLGGKTIKATLVTGESYDVDCANCASGYDPPTGTVVIHKYKGESCICNIIGINQEKDKIEYRVKGYDGYTRTIQSDHIFLSEDDAKAKAVSMEDEHNREEMERFLKKEKQTRTWAHHVSYHRARLKEALRQVEYHEKKLGIAKSKVKEDKELK